MSLKLITNLNFTDKLNEAKAVTEAGKEMLQNYKGYLYSNPVTCGLVNGFVAEAQKFNFDAGLTTVLESVLNFINENKYSWRLASACESISNNTSSYSYIAKLGVEQVEKLLEMDESNVVSYVKAGALKNIQYIPEFREVCKSIFKASVNEQQTNAYNVFSPVSYVVIEGAEDNKEVTFSVLGKAYTIKDGKVNESSCKDTKFVKINSLLESFVKDENGNLVYEYKGTHGDTCQFVLESEDKMTFTKGDKINETFETPSAFMEKMNEVSKIMPMYEKINFMKVTNAIAEVFESMNNVVVLDWAKLINTSTGVTCAIIEGKDNVNVTVFRSIHNGTSCKNYDYVVEALNDINKMTGVNLNSMYTSRIDEDAKKKDPEEYVKIQEELKANEKIQIEERKKKIAMLAELFKNDPARIALLNKVAKELQILEEEKTTL